MSSACIDTQLQLLVAPAQGTTTRHGGLSRKSRLVFDEKVCAELHKTAPIHVHVHSRSPEAAAASLGLPDGREPMGRGGLRANLLFRNRDVGRGYAERGPSKARKLRSILHIGQQSWPAASAATIDATQFAQVCHLKSENMGLRHSKRLTYPLTHCLFRCEPPVRYRPQEAP